MNSIEEIIDFLEENPQPAAVGRNIIRRLFSIIPDWTDFERTVLESIDGNKIIDTKKFRTIAWENFNNLTGADEIRNRLIFGLLEEDRKMEFVDAGFILHWAKELGLDENEVHEIFFESIPPRYNS